MVYVAISIAIVNFLAVVVVARLGRRLSGTTDQPLRAAVCARRTHANPFGPARPALRTPGNGSSAPRGEAEVGERSLAVPVDDKLRHVAVSDVEPVGSPRIY
jgi:hypothetical protein